MTHIYRNEKYQKNVKQIHFKLTDTYKMSVKNILLYNTEISSKTTFSKNLHLPLLLKKIRYISVME